jgi:two-component system, NarL family, response regulator LiaR
MNKERPIRVMIVDDHAVVRSGLSAFLLAYDDLELVGEAGGGKEAVANCRQNAPDVVLMDLVMPEMDGAETTREILKTCPNIKVIALTSFPEEDLVQKALKAGALSYLLKNVSGDELAKAIRAGYAGQATLAPEATEALIHSATKPPTPGQDLTDRELEVLGLMAKGVNNDTIAKELFVSASTVKFHVSNVLMKLGAATRTEAVAIALKNNLVGKK